MNKKFLASVFTTINCLINMSGERSNCIIKTLILSAKK
jgi:hypothetical protein